MGWWVCVWGGMLGNWYWGVEGIVLRCGSIIQSETVPIGVFLSRWSCKS